jgi:hypothetical protein
MRSPGSGIGSTGLDGSPAQDQPRGPSKGGAPNGTLGAPPGVLAAEHLGALAEL